MSLFVCPNPKLSIGKNVRFIQELSNNPVVRQARAKKGCKPSKSPVDYSLLRLTARYQFIFKINEKQQGL